MSGDKIENLAFLGTGIMGAPMATNLLKAGFRVTVWNRTRAKAEALAPLGARVAPAIAEAVRGAGAVISMLENGPAVEAVLGEAHEAIEPGAIAIDMSSIPPPTARACAARLSARAIEHLDAPVSGGEVGAKAATLAIMVGGAHETFERAQPIFAALGRAIYVGPSGAGQLAKLANQVIVGVTIGAVAEALLLAAAGGADPAAVRSALMGGFADSRILTLHGERMLERNFAPGAASKIQLKDLVTAQEAAREAGISLPLTDTVEALFRALVEGGGADWDHSALLKELERRNAPARAGNKADRLPSPKAAVSKDGI